ncbi:MAG: papain-like cysteine protease family protein [Bryobacteraceae bacterium]|jgi:hypothetical protein
MRLNDLIWLAALLIVEAPRVADVHAAQPKTQYTVPGHIVPLKQNGATCWATTATMMYNWRHKTALTVQRVVATAGDDYTALVIQQKELPTGMKDKFIHIIGLEAEGPQDFSDEGWFDMLRKYGLLWVTTSTVFSDEPWSTHARLIRGARLTPRFGHLMFMVVDPETGTQYEEDSDEFNALFDRLGFAQLKLRPNADMFSQVFHFGATK